jgi:hypothetical protein
MGRRTRIIYTDSQKALTTHSKLWMLEEPLMREPHTKQTQRDQNPALTKSSSFSH